MALSCPHLPSPCHCGNSRGAALCWRLPRLPGQAKKMLELSSRPTANPQASVATVGQQSRRLLLALALLLVALAAVLIKDRDFWFGDGSATVEIDTPENSAAAQAPVNPASQPNQTVQEHISKKSAVPAVIAKGTSAEETPAVTAKRTVLPPLEVEVVAGSKH